MRGLLQLPEILGQSSDGGRRVEDDLSSVQSKQPGAFGEVAVIADVDADGREPRLEYGVPQVSRFEEILFPEPGRVRDVVLAVFAEIRAVGIVDGGGVVVDARLLPFVDRHDNRHAVSAGLLSHQVGGRPWHRFCDIMPVSVLGRAEVRPVEDFLQPQNLHAAASGFFDQGEVHVDRGLTDFLDGGGRISERCGCLNETADHSSCHAILLGTSQGRGPRYPTAPWAQRCLARSARRRLRSRIQAHAPAA